VEILPGDEIRTKCVYNTTSKNATTRFGWGAQQEMCFAFLTFYPVENVLTDLFEVVLYTHFVLISSPGNISTGELCLN
jgi:hypothetical protein